MDKISFNYKLSAINVLNSFKAIKSEQKKKIRYAVYIVIFILLAAVWLVSYVQNPSSYVSILLAVLCFAFALITCWLPSKNQKDIARAVEEAGREFYMEFSDGKIFFCEDKTDYIDISGDYFYYETDGEFIIDAGGDKVFCAPKKFLSESETERIREILSAEQEKFCDMRKRLEEKIDG